MAPEQESIVALGSNLASHVGSPGQTVAAGLGAMAASGLALRRVSRAFRTPCHPVGAGPDYVNACAVVAGPADPVALLDRLHRIEADFDRARTQRWGARTLDLDLIACGGSVLPDVATQRAWAALPADRQMTDPPDRLILPHPRLQDRAFVLVPLADVAPDWRHPVTGARVHEMLAALAPADRDAVVPEPLETACQEPM